MDDLKLVFAHETKLNELITITKHSSDNVGMESVLD